MDKREGCMGDGSLRVLHRYFIKDPDFLLTLTSERVNAELRTLRGLGRILVRGLAKARCIALWCALAYNVVHFAKHLVGQ
jgi:hypothetical protein